MEFALKHRDITIFLAEDDEIDRMAFERFVKKNALPYRYVTADSIRQGREVLANTVIDVAVVDYSLKDGTGMELLDVIADRVPVIFVTGHGNQKVAVEAMKAGVYDYLIKDADRNYLQLLPVTIDNAIDHRRTEERLRQLESEKQRLLWMVSKTENAMAIASRDGRVEWVNEGFERLSGWQADDVIGTFGDMLLDDSISGLNPESEHYRNVMKSKGSVQYESLNFHKDGNGYWVLTTLTPIFGHDGEVEHIIAIDSNITDRKKAEDELLKAKLHAETLTRTKQEFLANLSHEIRTPMNAIVGIVQLLTDSELNSEQREYLRSIEFASDNLLNIINDVLDLSKLEAGQVVYESIPFNVKEVVTRTADIFRLKAKEKGLLLETSHGPEVPATVTGDPTRLNQILANLISNALKFTENGTVKVNTRLMKDTGSGVVLEFAVSDSGIGIAPENQKKIFESFGQADSDTTRKFGGTGLGLTIIKRLAEDMDGSVGLKSALGQGSVFTVTLPFTLEEAPTDGKDGQEQPTADLDRLNGAHGLIAEDNELNRMVATRFLEAVGIVVACAVNGLEAVQMAADKDYDFILMDIQMPEIDGYEAARRIRSSGSRVPIIAMTAHAFSGEREKCIAAGMDSYLTKPVRRELLHSRIAEFIAP
ncbi:MAG: response regulator [Flavobacteriales bacterium]|nr:response regulator [Flavobacteriales bacterium]